MTAIRADDEPPGGRRALVVGHGRGAVGGVMIMVGAVTGVSAHVGASDTDGRGPMLVTSLLVLVVIAATGAGVELVRQGAEEPTRHVFRFGTLRFATATLFVVGAVHLGTSLWFDFFGQWAQGRVDSCLVAGIGSFTAAVAALIFAGITGRLAWRAFLDEYWARR